MVKTVQVTPSVKEAEVGQQVKLTVVATDAAGSPFALKCTTISDRFVVYDVSDPAHPKLTETVKVDARLVNDISTTADGKILVISREGASNRKNGIGFYDTSDPAHPKLISEYTATVTGGVHSAFVSDHYVYLTDDATGSMRVIDFADVKNPQEVARWQTESPLAGTIQTKEGDHIAGRYIHDLQISTDGTELVRR